MKSLFTTRPGMAVVILAAAVFNATVHGAPKKPQPDPATEPSTAPKRQKLPSASTNGKDAMVRRTETGKPEPAAKEKAAPAAKSIPKTLPPTSQTPPERYGPPKGAAVGGKPVAAKTVIDSPKAVSVQPEPVPEKKGFFKKLFGKVETPEEKPGAAVPKLAQAKTAKPAPVKVAKTEKPAVKTEEAPPEKHSFLSLFRRGRTAGPGADSDASPVPEAAKIVRPSDWKERRVVKDDEIALYEYGPSQVHGPDTRLDRGTLVKVKTVTKGWALVEFAGGRTGYLDASALRMAQEDDFKAPVVVQNIAAMSPDSWAPAAPPPDLPDQPGKMDNAGALLLLPPLELEPKAP